MDLNYETLGININSSTGKADEIATPQNIADDMVTLFDYTDCNRKIWMDMYCKTGNFLASLKKQGVNKNNMAAICQTLQSQMLVCRKLYGQILPEIEVEIKIKSLESCKVTRRGQVYYISNWKEKVKNNVQEAYNIIKFVVMKEMERTMSLDWTTEEDFKINNIIMNPPYNPNDMYIDFVKLAKNLATEATVVISPAKWQAKGSNDINERLGKYDDKNGEFRAKIVPYMSNIVYYVDEHEVFPNITCQGGITYFLINSSNDYIDKIITTVEKGVTKTRLMKHWSPEMGFNLTATEISILDKIKKDRSILNSTTAFIPVKGYFISKDADDKSFEAIVDNASDIFYVDTKQRIGVSADYINHIKDVNKYKILASGWASSGSTFKGKKYKPNEICGRKYINICVGTENECDSAMSYYSCKLIWWLVYRFFNVSKLNTYSFGLVPDPGAFDHIFTDEELYKKYNLTSEEINIIESVIKERK